MIKKLIGLGLTDGEARVYYALLQLGSSTVGPIVKKSKIAYSNIYEVLDRLSQKGLVTHITKQKTKYFQASHIENLKFYLEEKEQHIEQQKETLQELWPHITSLVSEQAHEAEVFVGFKGLTSAYAIMLEDVQTNDTFNFFFNAPDQYAEAIDSFYVRIGKIFRDKKVSLKGIAHESYRQNKGVGQTPWTKMRYVDFPTPTTIDICKDKIMLITWEQPMGVLITSLELAEGFRQYFESVWKQAKK